MEYRWQRFIEHGVRLAASVTLVAQSWLRPITSGYRQNWRLPDHPPLRYLLPGAILLEGSRSARPGETVTVIIVPTYPQQWTAVTTGTALEMIDNRDRVVATGEILSTEGLDDPRWQDRKFDREARNLDEALRRSGIDTF